MSQTVHHPIFARVYAQLSQRMEQRGGADHRRRLLAGLQGRVIEVGAGNGLNFPHYPTTVSTVLAVEPEAHLRALAQDHAQWTDVPIEVVDGLASRLPAADATFDAAVVSLVLCSVPDQIRALTEIRRVLRPNAELRFFEHVRADTSGLQRTQRVLDATIWPTVGGGCHTSRDTTAAISAAGFDIEAFDRFRFPETPVALPTSPHVLGIARRR